MLANSITAFNYWNIIDKELKGFLTLKDFLVLLESTAFDVSERNIDYVRKEAAIVLPQLPNELNMDSKTNIYRFRLFECLFLERCAIY